jgi:Protein of unknown function (DUF3443)
VLVVAALHRPPPVVVALHSERSGGNGAGLPLVDISVGSDRSMPVSLDTGSVGLRIFADELPRGPGTGITTSTRRDSVVFADGEKFSGVVAYATVRIGGVRTAARIPFELVNQATCVAKQPHCPASLGDSGLELIGEQGLMGVGLIGPDSADPADNPLLRLPRPYSASWSIALAKSAGAGGRLVLGAPEPAPGPGTTEFQLRGEGVAPDGTVSWADYVYACWKVGPDRPPCTPTLFDSGASFADLQGVTLARLDKGPPQNSFRPVSSGVSVSVAGAPGFRPFWSFVTGSGPGLDVVTSPGHRAVFSAPVGAFRSFTITYDTVDGFLTLSTPNASRSTEAA